MRIWVSILISCFIVATLVSCEKIISETNNAKSKVISEAKNAITPHEKKGFEKYASYIPSDQKAFFDQVAQFKIELLQMKPDEPRKNEKITERFNQFIKDNSDVEINGWVCVLGGSDASKCRIVMNHIAVSDTEFDLGVFISISNSNYNPSAKYYPGDLVKIFGKGNFHSGYWNDNFIYLNASIDKMETVLESK